MTLAFFYSTRNIVDIACTVNNELEKLDIWFRVNKLSLNVNKTNVIMFANKKTTQTNSKHYFEWNEH